MVEGVHKLLSLLTIAGDLILIFLAVQWIAVLKNKKNLIINFIGRNALLFSYIVALIATLGSLFYSEIAKYTPCTLCWYQRILMYPQVILLGRAFLKKDRNIIPYSLILSGIGASIAFYHYLLQINVVPSIGCPLVGYSSSCSQNFVMEFGYITIPMMSLTAFLLIIAFLLAKPAKK